MRNGIGHAVLNHVEALGWTAAKRLDLSLVAIVRRALLGDVTALAVCLTELRRRA